jgi:hypothetical protein
MIARRRFTFSDWDLNFLIAVLVAQVLGGSLSAQPVDRYSLPLDREAPRGIQMIGVYLQQHTVSPVREEFVDCGSHHAKAQGGWKAVVGSRSRRFFKARLNSLVL